uniref:Anoctamin dimerisation domain-containing protein n=1 Tax=Cynoglossus semilaevis TaxID=244447 RepID=A0A3P8V6H3_CYNSE
MFTPLLESQASSSSGGDRHINPTITQSASWSSSLDHSLDSGTATIDSNQHSGMHTSISEILKEKSLKPSRRSLPCLAQSQTHPINLNHFLSVPLSPESKTEVEGLSQAISTSCSLLSPQTADDVKDHYTEESEVTTCETRADESSPLQKPVTRSHLEARTYSLKVPNSTACKVTVLYCLYYIYHSELLLLQVKNPTDTSGLFFRDGKKRIDYILVYKKSSPQVEKRCTFEKNLRAEGLMLEKEVQVIITSYFLNDSFYCLRILKVL